MRCKKFCLYLIEEEEEEEGNIKRETLKSYLNMGANKR